MLPRSTCTHVMVGQRGGRCTESHAHSRAHPCDQPPIRFHNFNRRRQSNSQSNSRLLSSSSLLNIDTGHKALCPVSAACHVSRALRRRAAPACVACCWARTGLQRLALVDLAVSATIDLVWRKGAVSRCRVQSSPARRRCRSPKNRRRRQFGRAWPARGQIIARPSWAHCLRPIFIHACVILSSQSSEGAAA
eukprot:COSAG03_NODE_995_length_5074_cov_4.211658_2_plen_192_part_00